MVSSAPMVASTLVKDRLVSVQDLIDASTSPNPRPVEEVEAVIQFPSPATMSKEEQFFIEELAAANRMTQNFMGEWGEANNEASPKRQMEDDYSEQVVELEKMESNERMAKIRALVSERDLAVQRMMTTVRDQEREHPYHPEMSPPSPSASSRGPSARYLQSAALRSGSHQKPDSQETREVNARVVAEKLQRKQARTENVNRRQQQCIVEQAKSRKAMCTSQELADRISEQRVQERAQRQAEKIYRQQQKQCDQKKMLHEIQRDQERQWKLLQEKNYAHQMRRPSSSPALLRSKKAPVPEQQESVYSDMVQSHSLYNKTIANWQELEADNERRAETMWLKKLPGGKQAKLEQEAKDAEKLATKMFKVKRVANKIASAARLVKANSIDSNNSTRFNIRTPSETSTVTEVTDGGDDRCICFLEARILGMDTSPMNLWEVRMERCREWQNKTEEALQEKRMRDTQKLESIVQRSRAETQKRVRKAETSLQVWENKATVAAERRSSRLNFREAEYFAKQERQSIVRAESMAIEMELRDQNLAAAAAVREASLQRSKVLRKSVVERRKSILEMKDSRAQQNWQIQIEGFEDRSPTAKGHAEEARAKLETKQAYENEFRKKAQANILGKQSRSQQRLSVKKGMADSAGEALKRISGRKSTFGDGKSFTKGSNRPTELAMSPMSDLQPPAVILTPSHGVALPLPISQRKRFASDHEEVEGLLERAIDTTHDDTEPEGQREPDGCLSRPRSSTSRTASKTSWSNSRAASKMQANLSNTASPRGAKRLSDTTCDDSGSSADEEFLQELRTRSSKWLEEARSTKSPSSFNL